MVFDEEPPKRKSPQGGIIFLILIILLLIGWAAVESRTAFTWHRAYQTAEAGAQQTVSSIPTQTTYPTFTFQPTQAPLVWTPTPDYSKQSCTPLTGMDYSDKSRITTQLEAYVRRLPSVKSVSNSVSSTIYANGNSEVVFVKYVGVDGVSYGMGFIVYMNEFGLRPSTFALDGQCWIDPP